MRVAIVVASVVGMAGTLMPTAGHRAARERTLASAGVFGAPITHARASTPAFALRVDASPPEIVEAARGGDVERVRALIAQKANVNEPAGDGMTALHWAAHHGDANMTAQLLKAKASVAVTTRLGDHTPLHIASRNGHANVVSLLLKAGARTDARTTGGSTPLHFAAAAGDTAAIRALLRAKADPNAVEDAWQQTPLMFAAAADRADAIRLLLASGAAANQQTTAVDLTTRTAREQAATRKRNEVLFAFLPQTVKDSILKSQAPAPRAATPDSANVAADTVTRGAQPPVYRASNAAPPTQYLTPEHIQMAIDSGRAVLLASAPTLGAVQSDTSDGQVAGFEGAVGGMGGFTALHHAVRQGNRAAAMALVDGGADINLRTPTDSTSPLLLATINGHFDLAMQLVSRGADVTLASTAGATPLYATINAQWLPRSRFPQPQAIQVQQTTHLELMEAIIKAGADVNVRLKRNLWYFAFNNCGNANCGLEYLDNTTPFWRATYAVDVDAMRLLKAHGADHTLPSRRVPQARAARGGAAAAATAATLRTERTDSAGVGDTTNTSAGRVAASRTATTNTGGASELGAGEDVAALDAATVARAAAARAGTQPGLTAQLDSAARAVPPGVGVYPIHAAAGVGYGNGFAGNSHRHAPDGWMPAMRYLVEELGADVNARDNNGYTPLHHAAARGDNDMIRYLVSKGADVRAVSRRGQTTVDLANGPVQRLRPFPETIALLESLGAINTHRCVSC